MKNNFVAKHGLRINKPKIHVDKKRKLLHTLKRKHNKDILEDD